jgi:hypothetical protein
LDGIYRVLEALAGARVPLRGQLQRHVLRFNYSNLLAQLKLNWEF